MQLLTTSQMKAERACPRLQRIEYGLGYRPILAADVLRFGTLNHDGLEAWWLAAMKGIAGDERLALTLAAVQGEADPFDRVRAEELLRGYHYRWQDEPYEVLAVEQQFEADLVNPATGAKSKLFRLGGKIDAVVRDLRTGQVLIVEHKTSSEDISPGSEYWKRLRMDGQVSIYFAGARTLGHDVAGCLYDVLGKPGLRPSNVPLVDEGGVKIVLDAAGERVRTKDGKKWRESADSASGYVLQTRPETPEEFRGRLVQAISAEPDRYYSRGEVVRLEAELTEWQYDVWRLAQQIREEQRAGFAPRNPDSCVRYGRTCPFFPVCSGEGSLDDATRYRRITQTHEELSVQPGGEA